MIGGFTEWAHLRLRDHRPGPMSYMNDKNDAPQRSILGKYPERIPDTGAGPGQYQIPSTIGEGRSTLFGSPSGPPPAGESPRDSPRRGKSRGKKSSEPPEPLPKQYSLALMPDTPAFSMYHKIPSKPIGASVGPGEYIIPSDFGQPGKGPRFGERTPILTTRDEVPGPASYNIPRFGDEKPKRREFITSISTKRKEKPGPGPGSYDDPTTIAARLAPPKRWLYEGPRFGGRHYINKSNRVKSGPGPAQYGDVSRIMTKRPTRTPIFRPQMQRPFSREGTEILKMAKTAPGPGEYRIPSEFDRDYRKGVALASRTNFEISTPATGTLGPGAYNLGKPPMTSNGFRFAAHPYDPLTISARNEENNNNNNNNNNSAAVAANTATSALYNPKLDFVLPNKYCAVAGFGIGSRFPEIPPGGPLCYNVKPPTSTRGTVFYRGDYSRSTDLRGKFGSGGPSYNVENDTIAEGVKNRKGFTFGIRYPARATHQVCKPYDATTNINCQYEDETTWMTKIKIN